MQINPAAFGTMSFNLRIRDFAVSTEAKRRLAERQRAEAWERKGQKIQQGQGISWRWRMLRLLRTTIETFLCCQALGWEIQGLQLTTRSVSLINNNWSCFERTDSVPTYCSGFYLRDSGLSNANGQFIWEKLSFIHQKKKKWVHLFFKLRTMP